MNREKYIKDTSYREGYTDGYREGVNSVVSLLEYNVQKFTDDLIELNNKLVDLRVGIEVVDKCKTGSEE